MKRIQILSMAAAMVALVAVAALPASADVVFGDGAFFSPFVDNGVSPSQEFSIRRISSGAARPTTTINNTGDNANLCPTTQQVVNTGNVANEQGVVLGPGTAAPEFVLPSGFFVGSDGLVHDNDGFIVGTVDDFIVPVGGFFGPTRAGDIDFEGSSINVDGSVSGSCTQSIEQAAAA